MKFQIYRNRRSSINEYVGHIVTISIQTLDTILMYVHELLRIHNL